jgi:hypothetical protein
VEKLSHANVYVEMELQEKKVFINIPSLIPLQSILLHVHLKKANYL